jgi:hypothetical protein
VVKGEALVVGPAVRHLGFRAKMALRKLRRRIVRLEEVFGG